MPWFKVDDKLATHPKVIEAGNKALGLWVRAGSWCMSHLTDGFVTASTVPMLGGSAADAKRLVSVGLWSVADGGWQFNDWMDYQPTKAQIETERAATAERVAKHRNKRASNTVTNAVSTPAPYPYPYPTPIDSAHLPESSPVSTAREKGTESISELRKDILYGFENIGVDKPFEVRAWFEAAMPFKLNMSETLDLAKWILKHAKDEVRNVEGYLRTVAERDPVALLSAYEAMDLAA